MDKPFLQIKIRRCDEEKHIATLSFFYRDGRLFYEATHSKGNNESPCPVFHEKDAQEHYAMKPDLLNLLLFNTPYTDWTIEPRQERKLEKLRQAACAVKI